MMKSFVFKMFYEVVRKTPLLNHLAHKIMQSEWVHHFPLYRWLYWKLIKNKAERIKKAPSFLEITLTDKCNARCIMCPPEVHTGNTFMDNELYERIIKEAYDVGIRKLIITGGEALLDREIHRKISYAKDLGYEHIHMFTNGSLMNETRSEEIISSGLDSLTWSIDSSLKEEYEKIRVGLKFDKVISNMKGFSVLRNQMNSKKPLTRINMVALEENKLHRKKFREFFSNFVDIVEIIDSHNFAGSQSGLSTDSGKEYSQLTRYPCHLLFIKLVVWPNGIVRKCSIDYAEHANMGDLKSSSVNEVLNSTRLIDLKNRHLKCDFNEPGCDVCTFKESWWVKPV